LSEELSLTTAFSRNNWEARFAGLDRALIG